MSWEMTGKYLVNCNCQLICPCPVDGPPTGPNGECRNVTVFQIASGNLDDTDLSGVAFAFAGWFASNLSAGNWKVGIVVDDGASDAQASALETILHGDAGGPFADFAGHADFTFEPLPGPGGGFTTEKNAMYGFAEEFRIGKGPGHSDLFGLDFDGVYGESSDFTYASEMAENAPRGRA